MRVEIDLRARFNPELDKAWFGAINEMIEAITMLSVILTGAALIREHGTIEHLLVMPVTAFEIIAGKIWSLGLVVLAATAFCLVLVVHPAIMYAAPNTYFVMLAQAVLFRGAGLAVVWLQLAALSGYRPPPVCIFLRRFRQFLR